MSRAADRKVRFACAAAPFSPHPKSRDRAKLPVSSCSMCRLWPTTSAITIAASLRETVSVFMRGRAFRSRLLLGDAGFAKAGVPVRFGESRVLWVCRIALGPELRYREARGSARDLCRLFRGSRGGAWWAYAAARKYAMSKTSPARPAAFSHVAIASSYWPSSR